MLSVSEKNLGMEIKKSNILIQRIIILDIVLCNVPNVYVLWLGNNFSMFRIPKEIWLSEHLFGNKKQNPGGILP